MNTEKLLKNLAEGNGKATAIAMLEKSPTGIRGFDEITFGGLPKNRPTVLVGACGTGKTFISMEYVIKGVTQFNEPGVFLTFEEKSEELCLNVASLGHDLKSLVNRNKIYLEHLNVANNEIHEIGKYNIEGLFVMLDTAIRKVDARRIVLDSFDTLFANFDTRMLRTEFKRLFQWLKDKKVTAIITAETGDTFLTRLGLEENVADCVIELTNRITNQIGTRRIKIIKYRGSFHANNEYPFIIDNNGVNIFPLINQQIEFKPLRERISSGIDSLDEMLGQKGFYAGSSILVSGTAGTGKTSFAVSFGARVCKSGLRCLFCAFEEAPNQLLRNMESIGINLSDHMDSGLLQFYYARPSLQNLELHFMAIKEQIEQFKPSVIILDPVTNLMTEGPNSDVRSMLTRFIDFLKTKQTTALFTAAISVGSIARNPSDEGISSMADTWMMLQDIERANERATVFFVMKARGIAHSRKQMEVVMSKEGIRLVPVAKKIPVPGLTA
jgi:circadian clock protein KaiC